MTTRAHGYARYRLDGCRCYTCGWAVSVYELARQKAIASGTWQPFVDAAPVRAHIIALKAAGIGRRQIAVFAPISPSIVASLLYGKQGRTVLRVRGATAERILAVTATIDTVADGALVPSTGTRRRIQALAAAGYTFTAQATEIGWTVRNFADLLHREQTIARTARAVRAMFATWQMQAPTGDSAARTRLRAQRELWLPPLAWDEDTIDDPAAVPCVLPPVDGSPADSDELAIAQAYVYQDHPISTAVRCEIVRRLSADGCNAQEIAPYARTTPAYVSQIRSQLGFTRQLELAVA
jgi:hypothetical protein